MTTTCDANEVQESVPVPPDDKRASVTRNATALSVANVAARVCVLGLAVAMGRGLGVKEYGRYGFAVAVATIIVPVADIGITTYIWREVARERRRGDTQARYLLRLKHWLSLGALLLTAAIALLIGNPGQAAIVVIVLTSALADGISTFVYGYFQGREQMGFEARWTVTAALLRSLGGIALVLAFGRLAPVLGWMLTVGAVQLVVATRRFHASAHDIDVAGSGRQLVAWRSLLAMGVLSVSVLVYIRADSVLLGIMRGPRDVGLYTAAYAIMGATQIVPYQISQAISPRFSRTLGRDDRPEFLRVWRDGLYAVLLVSLPLALVTTVLATGLLRLLYGHGFTSGAGALSILVWASPLGVVNAVVAAALYAAGREGWPAVVASIAVVLNVLLNLWVIPVYGITGAAAITVVTESAVLVLQMGYVITLGIASIPRLPYVRIGIALFVLATVATGLEGVGVVAAGVLSVAAYAAVLVATGAVDPRTFVRLPAAVAGRRAAAGRSSA